MLPRNSELATVHVFGQAVTEKGTREVGERFAALVNEVGRNMHGVDLGIRVGNVVRMCDGCDRRAPTFERPAGWWTAADGSDYCTSCLAGGER